MKNIPIFTIEEHNKAFYVWAYCMKERIFPPDGNTLFHVDEHSDRMVPRYDSTIKNFGKNRDDILIFTREQVGIPKFIYSTIYIYIYIYIYIS